MVGPPGSRQRWDVAQVQLLLSARGGSASVPQSFGAISGSSESSESQKMDVTHQLPTQPKPDKVRL